MRTLTWQRGVKDFKLRKSLREFRPSNDMLAIENGCHQRSKLLKKTGFVKNVTMGKLSMNFNLIDCLFYTDDSFKDYFN
jgi:hypothetical protein